MHTPATMHVGPLGSTIHIIRADADTIAALAAVDWNRRFRRVCLDPVRGLITLMEPDCAFRIGERAESYWAAAEEGEAAADAFLVEVAPDLVVEAEITSADEGKAECYGQMGVRELWRLRARRGEREVRADFLALRPDAPPRSPAVSAVLEGSTAADVCEAVEGVRGARTRAARTEAVARIVRRRQRRSVRVREADPPACPPPGPEPTPGAVRGG